MAGLTLLYLAGCVVLHEGLSVAGLVVLSVAFLSLYFPVRARIAGRRIMRHGREAAAAIFEFLDRTRGRGHVPGRGVPARHRPRDRVRRRDRPRAGHRPRAARTR